jgi:8-oxo-dGTP pyrophosphatase MutT (NUDIX family)
LSAGFRRAGAISSRFKYLSRVLPAASSDRRLCNLSVPQDTSNLDPVISFENNGHRFQFRAGAVALIKDHILLHRLEGEEFWALPGGRVEMGEEATQTIEREFNEELGIAVRCGELLSVGENFFSYRGKPQHEIGMYFFVQLPEESSLLRLDLTHFGVEGTQHLEFKWFHRAALAEVDLRPLAVRKMLVSGTVLQRHFVQRANNVT